MWAKVKKITVLAIRFALSRVLERKNVGDHHLETIETVINHPGFRGSAIAP